MKKRRKIKKRRFTEAQYRKWANIFYIAFGALMLLGILYAILLDAGYGFKTDFGWLAFDIIMLYGSALFVVPFAIYAIIVLFVGAYTGINIGPKFK